MHGRVIAAYCGLGLLAAAVIMAAALMVLPPPSHLATIIAGIVILTACGGCIASYGLRPSSALLMIVMSSSALSMAMLAARSAATQRSRVPLAIDANDATCAVSVRGDLENSLYRRLERVLDHHRSTRAVLLNSAGGSALGITHAARLLRDRGVNIAVMHDQCDSACAFLWISAPQRIIAGPRRALAPGFHAPHLSTRWVGTLRAAVQEGQQRAYLRNVGLPADFIGWAYAPVDALWRPDAQALDRLGVATRFVQTQFPERLSFCP